MKNMFSVGELARYQGISRQTLIFYDRIGLFKPSFTDRNGYRYYSVEQMDYLDTILILKKIGFSLEEIREHMENYDAGESLSFLKGQVGNLDRKIRELSLLKSRLEHKCLQLERVRSDVEKEPFVMDQKEIFILHEPVRAPYDRKEISIATKRCYAEALEDNLPIFFQCGVSVPIERIREGRFTDASMAYLLTERIPGRDNVKRLPAGRAAAIYHRGDYYDIASSYGRLLTFCRDQGLETISDSYEFVINDYMTSGNEEEFLTKILFYVK